MNPCVFVIFSLLLLHAKTITSNQLGGGDENGVIMRKYSDKERRALLDFKSHLQDPNETLSTWRAEEENCCKWRGVTCNNQIDHVTGLDVDGLGLEGEISNSLLNLNSLNHLDLFGNSFHGTIPTFIGSMTRLRYLNLGWNQLNGAIPRSIGSLTELSELYLSGNSLYGIIPPEFGNLTNLVDLWLGIGSRVENLQWLSHLSHLELLEMNGISLSKQNYWVDVILSLRKLSFLSLDGCELSHVMYPYSSSFLNSSSSIEYLSLGNNNLNSSMYGWLFPFTSNKLRILDICGNMLLRNEISRIFHICIVIHIVNNWSYTVVFYLYPFLV
ncbi:unnamed protein product [Lactuca virosa]|uniref:Leucine-rich repeat-containing N-terminal plant-type domain-containing protein n=1 Tax=Lactuca virosa TaxID=75947 RepID=A0AAU9PTD1_9ASTR|nr:unnamed protein product [Lactuca virosa]